MKETPTRGRSTEQLARTLQKRQGHERQGKTKETVHLKGTKNTWPEKATAPHSSTLAWKIPWTEELIGCSPWGRWESDTTERLHFPFSLSCFGEGNGNPLQCSCLENPRDGRAWWAAVYGVTQSRIWLQRLSSSSSSKNTWQLLEIQDPRLDPGPIKGRLE